MLNRPGISSTQPGRFRIVGTVAAVRVIEQAVVARLEGLACLDAIVRTDRWVAVLDQSTPKAGPEPRLLDRFYGAFAELDSGESLTARELADALSAAVSSDAARERAGPYVTVVAVDGVQRRVVRIGDGHVVIDGSVHRGHNPVDDVLGKLRSLVLELDDIQVNRRLHKRSENDSGRSAIMPWLVQGTTIFRNHPASRFGFGALDGTHIPSRFIEEFELPDRKCTISIMTDGYPIPRQTLDEVEAELSTLINRDARMTSMDTTKGVASGARSFDDRAFVRVAMGRASLDG